MKENEKDTTQANDVEQGAVEGNADAVFALEQANRWVESADGKTSTGLTLISITFTIFAGFLLEKGFNELSGAALGWTIGLAIFTLILFLAALSCFVCVLIPRLTKPNGRDNPFYYGEVNRYETVELFIQRFAEPMSKSVARKCLLSSVYFNSTIAWKKMRLFRLGILFTAFFLLASAVTVVVALIG